jgi:hypothetical protein
VITETDDVAAALAAAAEAWPEARGNKNVLLLRLVAAGSESLHRRREEERTARLAALDRAAGALTGDYEPGYLEQLRADWPA